MGNLYFYTFEIGTILSILGILIKERKNKGLKEEIILAILYGLILETINVYLSKSYYYSNNFLIEIFNIPIAIGFGWAIIYYCTKKVADNYNLKWWQTPFLMALFAVAIDLEFDPIASKIGFWQWVIKPNQEWFGVPYDNFFGWAAVIWTFAFLINLSKLKHFRFATSKIIRYSSIIVSPILLDLQVTAFIVLSALMSGRFSIGEIAQYYKIGNFGYAYAPEMQNYKAYIFFSIYLFLSSYLLISIYKNKENIKPPFSLFSFIVLFSIYASLIFPFLPARIENKNRIIFSVFGISILLCFLIIILPLYLSKTRIHKVNNERE